MEFNYATIERFSAKIRYKLETYIDAYTVFTANNLPAIMDYYTNPAAQVEVSNFNTLTALIEQSVKIDNIIKINRQKFNKIDEWELATFLEDIKMKLSTYDNLGKWLRSAKDKNSWKRSLTVQSNYTLAQGETIEEVERQIRPDGNEQNDWVEITLENELLEGDYSTEGGNVIKVAKVQGSSPNFFLQSVVDNLSGDKLYGIDINQKFTFVDNDIMCLTYHDTLKQSIHILVNLRVGEVPEMPNFGTQEISGSSFGAFLYSGFTRQMTEVFATDDTLKDFKVTRYFYKEGDLYLEYKVDTFYNQTFGNQTVKLN